MESSNPKGTPFRRPSIMATATSDVALVPLAGEPVLYDGEGRIREHPLLAENATPSPVVNPFQMNMVAVVVLVSNELLYLPPDEAQDKIALSIGRSVLAKASER